MGAALGLRQESGLYGLATPVTQPETVGVVVEFVLNVIVALLGEGAATVPGVNVIVNTWLPPAGMLFAEGGAMLNSLAFAPVMLIELMLSGCELGALVTVIVVVVDVGNPVAVLLAGGAV